MRKNDGNVRSTNSLIFRLGSRIFSVEVLVRGKCRNFRKNLLPPQKIINKNQKLRVISPSF